MSVISIVNQKGGVGKTTTSVNLASILSELGKKVLIIDLDPQGNATTGVGIDKNTLEVSVYNMLVSGENIEKHIIKNIDDKLDIIPAKIDLAGAEVELVGKISRESRLKRAVDKVKDHYDAIIIDCAPSLGLLTINSLTASDYVIIPIQCEFYAMEGLAQLLNTIELVKEELNPGLEIAGILLTMYDARLKLSEEVAGEVKKYFGKKLFETIIPRNIKLSEAPSYGMPINKYDSSSRGAAAYREVAKEVITSGYVK
jgi:chromosome partitioning protein